MAKSIGKKFGFNFLDFFKWLTNIAMLAGWGTLDWQDLNEEKKQGIIYVTNSPIATELKGKVTTPVDYLIRGFLAGGASASFSVDIDCVEEECIALGAKRCKFVIYPKK